jgi:hypothetical protein
MQNQLGFIVKLIFFSGVLSFLIKYEGASLAIPQTTTNVIVIILLPTLMMTALLIWRIPKTSKTGSGS